MSSSVSVIGKDAEARLFHCDLRTEDYFIDIRPQLSDRSITTQATAKANTEVPISVTLRSEMGDISQVVMKVMYWGA